MATIEDELFNYESPYLKDGVLINNVGITSEEDLNSVSRSITSYKLAKLYLEPQKETFDVEHYLSIHKYIFEDIYPFAGKIRKENISKRIPFCPYQYILDNLRKVLEKLKKDIPLMKDRETLLKYITVLYSDLDIIHPFREGNGRCEREFIRELIDYICKVNHLEPYYLDYGDTSKEEFVDAIVKADAYLDYNDLYNMLNKMLKVKEENRNR